MPLGQTIYAGATAHHIQWYSRQSMWDLEGLQIAPHLLRSIWILNCVTNRFSSIAERKAIHRDVPTALTGLRRWAGEIPCSRHPEPKSGHPHPPLPQRQIKRPCSSDTPLTPKLEQTYNNTSPALKPATPAAGPFRDGHRGPLTFDDC